MKIMISQPMRGLTEKQIREKAGIIITGIYKLQGAMTVVDNSNGKVVAIVGIL